MSTHTSRFLISQRALIKVCLINLAESNRLYGLEFQKVLRDEFKEFGYKPRHSEIYKSLHELDESGILRRIRRVKIGKKYQEVYYYVVNDTEAAELYKEQVRTDLDRCCGLLGKARKSISY